MNDLLDASGLPRPATIRARVTADQPDAWQRQIEIML